MAFYSGFFTSPQAAIHVGPEGMPGGGEANFGVDKPAGFLYLN